MLLGFRSREVRTTWELLWGCYVDKLKLETSLLLTAGIEKTNCIKLTSSIVEMEKKS